MGLTYLTREQERAVESFRAEYDTVHVRRCPGRSLVRGDWVSSIVLTGGTGDAEAMIEEAALIVHPGGGTRAAPPSEDECSSCPGIRAEFGRLCGHCYDTAQDWRE